MLISQWDCRQRGLAPFLSVIAVFCLMCSAAWGAISATITKSGDIFLKDSATGKTSKFVTLKDAYSGHYHSVEYRNGCVYVIRRTGWHNDQAENPNWRDELWRYDRNGHGRKLWSRRGLDFRVSPDGKTIAILSSITRDGHSSDLCLLDFGGKLRKKFRPAGLVKGDFDFERWDGRYLWMKDQETVDIYSFIRIDTRVLDLRRYPVELDLSIQDYDLNTKTMVVAYSDYPVMFDTESYDDYMKSKSLVHLYAYDLRTQRKRLISKCVTDVFSPKWVGSSTLEFDNPKGKGRLKKHVSF